MRMPWAIIGRHKNRLTNDGRTYFIRKHVADKLRELGVYDPKRHDANEFVTIADICDACEGTPFWPVVCLFPYEVAKEIESGVARVMYSYTDGRDEDEPW